MTAAMRLSLLPARYGDCLWLECRSRAGTRRVVVDGGTTAAAPRLRARIAALPASERHIDLFVVSHVDADHIGGALDVLRRPPPGLTLGDVWFNDRRHLPRRRGAAQGQQLAALLDDMPDRHPWNVSFGGDAVATSGEGAWRVIELDWGATVTVLSPTPEKLAKLAVEWDRTVRDARAGVPSDEEPQPVTRSVRRASLAELAATPSRRDRTAPNGSSIAMLVEHGGRSVLLAADAHPDVLTPAVRALARSRGEERLRVDAVKLPHHGSQANVTVELLESLASRRWLFSTNGDRFGHPDAAAVARVILHGGRRPTLCFNYRSPTTRRWGSEALVNRHAYGTVYPASRGAGLTIEL